MLLLQLLQISEIQNRYLQKQFCPVVGGGRSQPNLQEMQ